MRKLIGFILILLSFFFVLDIKVRADCGFFGGICGGTCTGGTCQVEYVNLNCVCVVPTTAPPPTCYKNGRTCSRDDQCCSGYCAEGNCATRPVATNTPTQIPCDIDGNGVCNTSDPHCLKISCNNCGPGVPGVEPWYENHYNGTKTVHCWTSASCSFLYPDDPCYQTDSYSDPIFCSESCSTSFVPTPPEPTCQPYACYDMGDPHCQVSFTGCPEGVGKCDNCGTDCGTCSGALPGSTPVPTVPACVQNCLDPAISPCISTICVNQTCLGNCYQYCYGMMPGDCSCANNLCSTQTCTGTCNETCTGQLTCAPTTLNRFEIRRWDSIWSFTDSNVNGRDITDAQNRLHICDPFLSDESPHPRSVVYVAWLNNLNGCGDIDANSVKMKWLGNNAEIAMTKLASYQSGPCAYTATVTYPTDTNIPSAQGFQITMKSISGGVTTDWTTVTPDLKLKVWNCQVPVSGTLYDGSAGQVCPGTGFSVPIDGTVGFNSIIFSDTPDITMTDNNLNSYGTDYIVWGKTYLPLINGGSLLSDIDGDLLADVRKTRIIDLAVGTTTCPTGSSLEIGYTTAGVYNVNPYSSEPRARIDFSFIRDQEAWYQVEGAGVKSRTLLQYGVPVTAPGAIKFLTLGNLLVYNGLVSATSFENTNGNNNNEFGSPNNWWIDRNTNNLDIYNYQYFYDNFYVKAGIGEIKTNSWGGWTTNKIYFVNDNLDINQDLTVPDGETMMVIVNGNITIDPLVTRLDGIYIANGSILAGGTDDDQLVINGMLYARGNIRLYRSFSDKTVNNTTPAVKINYSPGLIFNLPPEIMRVLSGWREE